MSPRLFIEPDGSFVWTGEEAGQSWQVDGNLIDRGDFLAYVELKGRCPEEQFDELLTASGWPQSPLEFQLPRRGVTLNEAEFRALATCDAGAI